MDKTNHMNNWLTKYHPSFISNREAASAFVLLHGEEHLYKEGLLSAEPLEPEVIKALSEHSLKMLKKASES